MTDPFFLSTKAGLGDLHSIVVHAFIILFTESYLNYMCSCLSFPLYCGYKMHPKHNLLDLHVKKILHVFWQVALSHYVLL